LRVRIGTSAIPKKKKNTKKKGRSNIEYLHEVGFITLGGAERKGGGRGLKSKKRPRSQSAPMLSTTGGTQKKMGERRRVNLEESTPKGPKADRGSFRPFRQACTPL